MRKYDSYKDSGIEWIGEIPEHWTIATIGRLTNLGRGRVISAIEIAENEGEFPVYSSQTENNGIMGCLNSFDFEGEYVTWTTDGANAGTVFYREGKFNCTNVCGTIQPKNWEQIELKFLPYYLNLGTKFSVRLDINPKLMNNMMAKIPLVIPPKTEQTAIATYLDRKTAEIDELIADKKRLLEFYEEEKTAIINQAVTKGINPDSPMKDSGIEWLGEIPEHWEVKRLKTIARVQTGRTPKIQNSQVDFFENGEINWFTPSDFDGNSELIDSKRKLISDAIETGKVELFPEYSIYLVSIGATLGKVSFFREKASANQQINIIIFHQIFNPLFGYYFLVGNKEMITLEADYTTLPILNQSKTKSLFFAVPPFEEQQSIVHHIATECSRVQAKKAKTEKLIELLTEYRTALISEVVTGKIKVTQ